MGEKVIETELSQEQSKKLLKLVPETPYSDFYQTTFANDYYIQVTQRMLLRGINTKEYIIMIYFTNGRVLKIFVDRINLLSEDLKTRIFALLSQIEVRI